MAFNKLGEAFVEVFMNDSAFQRKTVALGSQFATTMGKITQSAGNAASAGIGVLTAGFRGTEVQIKAVSSASSKLIGTIGKATARVGDSIGKFAAKKIDLRINDTQFQQRLRQTSQKHRQTIAQMEERSKIRLRLQDREYRSKVNRLAKHTIGQAHTMRNAFAGVLAGIGVSRAFRSARRGLSSMVSVGFAFNAEMQQMQTSFTQMLGSASRADKVIGDIRSFSESTPFQIGDLTQAAVGLMSTKKIAEEELLPTLKKLGDAAAGSAKGFESMPRITWAVTKALSKGKIQAQEMMQLAQAGIPAWEILAEATGKSTAELQQMGQKGQLGADMVLKLIDGLGARFEGLAEKQSKTFAGLWSTLVDKGKSALGRLSEPLFELSTANLAKIIEFLDSDKAKSFISAVVAGMSKITGAIKAAFESPAAMAVAKFVALAGAVTVAAASVMGLVATAAAFKTILIPVVAIGSAASVAGAAIAAVATSFKLALASERGKAIIANLVRIKDLAVEIGMNLRDAIGRGIDFVSEKFNSLFGGNAMETAGKFWETVTSKIRDFMDLVSLLTTNFSMTWEIVKTGASLAVSDMADRFKHLFVNQIPFFFAGLVEGIVAGGKVIVDGWWDLFVGVVASIEQLFTGMIAAQKRRLDGVIEAIRSISRGDLGGAMEGISRSQLEAAGIQIDAAAKAGKSFRDNAGDVVSDAAEKFADAFSKTQAAMPEFERSQRGDAIQEYMDSLLESVAAEREGTRAQRAASDAIAKAVAANEAFAAASEAAANAATRKAAADSAAAAMVGPQLSEEQAAMAASLQDKFKDPSEKFREAAKHINDLFAAGGIDEEIYGKAISESMKEAAKGMGDEEKRSSSFASPDSIANKIQEAILGGNVEERQLAVLEEIAAAVQKQAEMDIAGEQLAKIGQRGMDAAKSIGEGKFADAWDIISGKTDDQRRARTEMDAANQAVADAALRASEAVAAARTAVGGVGDGQIAAGLRGRIPELAPPRGSGAIADRQEESKSEKETARNTKIVADGFQRFGNLAAGIVNFTGGSA